MFKKATHTQKKKHGVLYPVCGVGESEIVSIACMVYGVVGEGDPLLDVVGYEEVSRVLHHLVLSLSHVQHGAGGIMAQHLSQATSRCTAWGWWYYGAAPVASTVIGLLGLWRNTCHK